MEIEHSSSITPLIFSSTGGLGPTATVLYKWALSLLADKWDQHYSTTLGWLRCSSHFPSLEPLSCALRVPGPPSIVWTDQHLPLSTLCLRSHCKMSPFLTLFHFEFLYSLHLSPYLSLLFYLLLIFFKQNLLTHNYIQNKEKRQRRLITIS